MKPRHVCRSCLVTALVVVATGIAPSPAVLAQQDRSDTEQETQVLTRGPVHEAFAETVSLDPR